METKNPKRDPNVKVTISSRLEHKFVFLGYPGFRFGFEIASICLDFGFGPGFGFGWKLTGQMKSCQLGIN
jgi:hypothetical protein